ncbi:alkaline phosphatase family protein [Cellulophaga baltica]|uniref:alkaline phosphatase D family protein n=1 Tax=Cellulophaga TaxID=104264 RepID=UPI001C077A05|nr:MULTISPECIES: alkaline phosphatase D family protein [Cellulophaga]MBU2996508.1 alkaline phosphatase family protein [Cellulophaga baltica]MDO6767902.1 alkaline phosphatase D family protein [Cellulophaga sp. 1_MG-2023]
MKLITPILFLLFVIAACKSVERNLDVQQQIVEESDFTIAFGSCNKAEFSNVLWDDILKTSPDVWIWGGDIVYADTDNMTKLKEAYATQNNVEGYKVLKSSVPVIGTWDDHDYGVNDGGVEFKAKKGSQQQFLDFMGVSKTSTRRQQEGVYAVHDYDTPKGSVKILVLDTRYFRTALTKDTETNKRNKPNVYGEGTVLGEVQWEWLENELNTSKADFNILVSSIQVLSYEHGFETWGNFPHEVDKLKKMIASSKAKGVAIISGDRHISEFSKTNIESVSYPLIDFTSSGLTHVYADFTSEENKYRVGEVVPVISFGTLSFDFEVNKITYKIVGDNSEVLGSLEQAY